MKEKYDIFIQAGQSNAEDSGLGPVTEEYIPDERICYLEALKTVITTNEGLDIQFHNEPFQLMVGAEHGTAENQIKGLLWHQGEHDAFEGNSGSFVSDWRKKNEEICKPILKSLQQVASEMQGEYVEADDLLSNNEKTGNGDDIHFCRESLHTLDRRYFDAYQKIVARV